MIIGHSSVVKYTGEWKYEQITVIVYIVHIIVVSSL